MKSPRRTVERARQLRREQTPFEAVLWKILRDRQLENYKFRRQHPIPLYIADFACIAKKLLVELDGRGHDHTVERDHNRDEVIKQQGWRVLRFSNVQLMRDREGVVQTVLREMENCS
ncbi:putative protein [Abditibacteriota bacterium]|nr:putative protein [Abditibacteriota bacterium]